MQGHHAYIYEGSLAQLPALVADARVQFNFSDEHSPDVHVREFEKFGIEESRWLSDTAALRPSSGRALFVLGVASITSEAQQALLKLLEEPQAGITFVLLVPHGSLLPTIISRMSAYPSEGMTGKKSSGRPSDLNQTLLPATPLARKFLSASGKERSEQLTKLLKEEEGIKERVRDFINALESELSKTIGKSAEARQGLEDIAMVRDYLRDRSPSLKMLLEHLALSLPNK